MVWLCGFIGTHCFHHPCVLKWFKIAFQCVAVLGFPLDVLVFTVPVALMGAVLFQHYRCSVSEDL